MLNLQRWSRGTTAGLGHKQVPDLSLLCISAAWARLMLQLQTELISHQAEQVRCAAQASQAA